MIIYCVLGLAAIWLVVIFKFAILDDGTAGARSVSAAQSLPSPGGQVMVSMPHVVSGGAMPSVPIAPAHKYSTKTVKYVSHGITAEQHDTAQGADKPPLPLISEWLFIRSNPKYEVETPEKLHRDAAISSGNRVGIAGNMHQPQHSDGRGGGANSDKIVVKMKTNKKAPKPASESSKKPSDLVWPPVNNAGIIPDEDGSDKMPIIGIDVPRFWFPPEGVDYNTIGSKVTGEETIFLMIASYRDFQCRETITSAFDRADHPERLFVGAVDQVSPGDVGCLDIDVPCSKDPSQAICKYRDQIAVYTMDAQYATGPVTARHIGDRMYRGQYFVMQMDAHCYFIRHWDTMLINQWRSTGNEMAVLSSYLTDVQGSISPQGDSRRHTRPIQCNSAFEGVMPARYLRHGSQPEGMAVIKNMPQLQPYWAAGFSFSRGHFKLRVPYDAYQPMVFQGEEIAIGIRGFTHGYDFYAPKDSVVFHEYAEMSKRRKKIHMFWENKGHKGMGQKSLKRATAVIRMAPDIKEEDWDHSELERYGLGSERDIDLFYKLFLIDTKQRKAQKLCPFVDTGIMHRDFTPYLRKDGNGIDYTFLEDYDTADVIKHRPPQDKPYWVRRIDSAMADKNKKLLQVEVSLAKQLGLYKTRPALQKRVSALLPTLKS